MGGSWAGSGPSRRRPGGLVPQYYAILTQYAQNPHFYEFWPPGASWGPFWVSWRPLGPLARSRCVPGPLLGRSWSLPGASWVALGASWAPLGPPWGRPWPILGRPERLLGLSRASFGGPGAALGRQRQLFTKHCKNHCFPWFLGLQEAPGSLPGALLAAPGAVLAALGRLLGRPGWSWVVLGGSWLLLSCP